MAGYGTVEYGTVGYGTVRCGAVWCGAGFCGPWCWVWRVKYYSFGWLFLLISENLTEIMLTYFLSSN